MSVLEGVSTFSAAVAAVAAVMAILYARATLKEARSTTEVQREAFTAAQDTVMFLAMMVTETSAARTIEQLTVIAADVARVSAERRPILAAPRGSTISWHDLRDAQHILAADLASVAGSEKTLPKCQELATGDPRYTDALEEEAKTEIRQAIQRARDTALELSRQAAALYDSHERTAPPAAPAVRRRNVATRVATRVLNQVKGWKK